MKKVLVEFRLSEDDVDLLDKIRKECEFNMGGVVQLSGSEVISMMIRDNLVEELEACNR